MAKRIIAMLLTIVMMFGMVIPVSAAEAPESPAPTTEVVVVEAEPAEEEEAPEETPEAQPEETAPAETETPVEEAPEEPPAAEDAQEPTDEEASAPVEEDSKLPVETETPEETKAPSEYVIFTGGEEESAAASDVESKASDAEEEDSYSQENVDGFIGAYLVEPGVVYPIDEAAYIEAGEEVPSVYIEVTEENAEQIAGARDDWKALTAAEQEAVDAVLCAAQADALVQEAIDQAAEEGVELSEEEIQALEEETFAALTTDDSEAAEGEELAETLEAVSFAALLSTAMDMLGISEEKEKESEEAKEDNADFAEAVQAEDPSYSNMTAEDFIDLHLTLDDGTIITMVSEETYEQILEGEGDWEDMAPEQKQLVNEAITAAFVEGDEEDGLSDAGLVDFEQLLVGARFYVDHEDEIDEVLPLEEKFFSGMLAEEESYIAADIFSFDTAGEQVSIPLSFYSSSIALFGNSNFGFDTDSSLILNDEKFQDQDNDLVIHPHYGSVVLSGTKYYIDWYDNQGNYWGMEARMLENILGRDADGNEHQVFCMSPARKFYDTNVNKAPGWDWNYSLSESQKKAIALTCLYGTNGDEYLQAAAQLIIFELATKYRSSTDFARQYKTWHSIVNGMSVWENYIEAYYLDLPYQLYLHGSSPSWMFDTHDEAVAGTYELTKNASTGNYEITLTNTDTKINGYDARKKEWVNRFEYTAYADKDYTTEISGVTFTSTQNTSSATKASITVSVPEAIYNKYGEIYIKVKTPSLKTSEADFRLWIPNSSSTTAGQTFIELVSGEGEPAYAYMTLRAGGNSNEFDLTVEKVAAQLADAYTEDGLTYVNPYGITTAMDGVTFGLYNTVDDNADGAPDKAADGSYLLGDLISQQEVDADGLATWTALNSELKYVLVEESAPLQYSISKWENGQYLVDNTTNKQTAVTVTAENQVRYYTFSIEKKDLGTDAALSGVTFGLYAEEDISWEDGAYDRTNTIAADTLMGTFTTGVDSDADGYMMETRTVNGVTTVTVLIPAGTYYIQEISAPDGYEIDSTKYTVIDFTGDEVTTNILNEDENTTMCSQFQALELYNKHTFELIATKKAKVLADPYTRSADGVTYVNTYSASQVLTGVTLGLYETVDANGDGTPDTNADGSYVLGTSKGEKTVNASGQATWTGLDDSKVYVLKELEVPLQYSSSANAHGEILVDNTTARDTTVEVDVMNYPRYTKFSIEKKASDTGAYLAGATFGIYAAEDISWHDYFDGSTNTIAADTLVGTFTTGTDKTDGNFPMKVTTVDGVTTVVMQVPLGKYYIKETAAPSGYELNETEYTVINYTGSETTSDIVLCSNTSYSWMGFYSENLSTQNGPLTIINKVPDKEYFDLVVYKKAEGISGISGYNDDGTAIFSESIYPLSYLSECGALFRLYEAVDDNGDGVADTDANGYYALGTLVSEQWTDNEGKLYWYGLDKEKQYVLQEAAAPVNYTWVRKIGGRVLITPEENTVVYEATVLDSTIGISISICKFDAETNKRIEGAVFGLYMGEDMYVPGSTTDVAIPKDTLIKTVTTSASGQGHFAGIDAIRPGYKYYVKELSVPDGWVLDSTAYYFDVFEDYVTYNLHVLSNGSEWDSDTYSGEWYYFNNRNAYNFYNDPAEPDYYPFVLYKTADVVKSVTTSDSGVTFAYDSITGNEWTLNTTPDNVAKFALYAAEAIYDARGVLVYNVGDRVTVYYAGVHDDPTMGDIDLDGDIDMDDVTLASDINLSTVAPTDEQLRRLDFDDTGEIEIWDVQLLYTHVGNGFCEQYGAITQLKETDTMLLTYPNEYVYFVQNPGKYTVKEIEAPDGWVLDTTEVSLTITEDTYSTNEGYIISKGPKGLWSGHWMGTNELTYDTALYAEFNDERDKLGFRVYKVDSDTQQPLSGATFGLYAARDIVRTSSVGDNYPDGDGGWYYTPGTTTTLVEEGTLLATATTGADGYAVFNVDVPTNDPDMSFYIMEISAPANYNKSYESWGPYSVKELLGETVNDGISTVAYANNTHTYTVTYRNTYTGYGNIYIEKTGDELVGVSVDADGNTQFKYTQTFLEGAKFSVYAAETIYGRDGSVEYNEGDLVRPSVTTNEDGVIFVENLPFGKYMVKEENAPYGYVTVLSTEYPGYIPGVDLLNSEDSANDEDSMDSDTVTDEDPAENREEAIKAVKFSAEKEVDIDGRITLGDYDVFFWNPRQVAKITVTKVEDGTNTPLAGAVFGLYAAEDIYSVTGEVLVNSGDLIAKATSASGGVAEFNVDIPIDYTYTVKEIVAPEGYTLSTQAYTVSFSYSDQEEAVQYFSYTFKNKPESGKLIIHKVGEAPVDAVQNDIYDAEAGYTITSDISPLEGAVYDVYNSSGTKIYSNLKTDENGIIVLTGLTSGTYRIVEKTAPTGYIISETEKTVNFNANNASTGSVTFTDERKHAYVEVYKIDATSSQALAGATFALMAGEDIAVGTTTIPAGAILETAVSGTDGYVNFTTDLPLGYKYQVKEIEAPEMYELSDEVFEFTAAVASGNNTTYTHSFTCENERGDEWEEPGSITVQKVDENGNALAGAMFKLEYSVWNGTSWSAWAPVYYYNPASYDSILAGGTLSSVTSGALTTDNTGIVIFRTLKALEDGTIKYRLTETAAPDGYAIPDDPVVFEGTLPVADATATNGFNYQVSLTVENEPVEVPGTLTVKKTDENGNPLAGAVFKLEYSTTNGTTWAPVYKYTSNGVDVEIGGTTASVTNGLLTTGTTGIVTFTGLKTDYNIVYRLTEYTAPDGYMLPDDPVIFQGTLPVADANAAGGYAYALEFDIVNEYKPGSLSVKKVSTFGTALAGATYLLEYSTDDGATWANIKAADPGQTTPKAGTTTAMGLTGGALTTTATANPVVFSDLRADGTVKYRLTEIKAPDGYDLVTETIYEGYLPIENGDDDVFEVSIVVHNSPVIKLPHTGASGFLFPALGACFGIGAGAVGILLRKGKKGKHTES